jgi:hypothetical protein
LAAGFEWAGFSALAFYMHTILRDLTVPFDEYWIAFFLQLYRCHINRTKSTAGTAQKRIYCKRIIRIILEGKISSS